MTLSDFVARVKKAAKRVAHHAAGVSLAERRIRYFRKRYLRAEEGSEARKRARRAIIRWKTRKFRAEDFLKNWRVILKRRRAQKKRYQRNHPITASSATFNGVAVPPWVVGKAPGPDGKIVNWLKRYQEHGWSGTVVSGIRTTAHSIDLCFGMCGAPSCPGTCAGAGSNHNCDGACPYPEGALDVSDFFRFKAIGQEIGSPLINDLPADPVHFSVSGH